MDFVPFTFCDSVCASFETIYPKEFHFRTSDTWEAAARDCKKNRIDIKLVFESAAGVCSYNLEVGSMSGRQILFDDLKRMNRRHIRVNTVCLRNITATTGRVSSLEEIHDIITYTLPLLYLPALYMYMRELPVDVPLALLTRFQSVPFWSICTNFKMAENFLTLQLQSADVLRKLIISYRCRQYYSKEFRIMVEDYAISNAFFDFSVPWVSDKAFFERLFEKTSFCFHKSCQILGKFSFGLAEIKAFKPELQVAPASSWIKYYNDREIHNCVFWRRADGVGVQAKYNLAGRDFLISFQSEYSCLW